MPEVAPASSPLGRRPGASDTRGEIVEAARATFAAAGYDRTSLRGIARRAGVDAALVHHYFPGGKPQLFAEGMFMGAAPDPVHQVTGDETKGMAIVGMFLSLWEPAEHGESGVSFAAFTQAVASSPEAGTAMREFLGERIWSRVGGNEPDATRRARHSLVATQLMGLGMVRYVLRLEPLATASPAEVKALVGPAVDAALSRDLTQA